MWGGKHSDLHMRSDVFVQNITMHYKCLLLFLYNLLCVGRSMGMKWEG